MRVLREVLVADAGVGTTDYDAYAMGARGVMWMPTDSPNARITFSARDAAVAREITLASPFYFAGADEAMGMLQFPLPYGVLRLAVVAGTVSGALFFVDEPLPPAGRWILTAETRAIGAGATAAIVPQNNYGLMRRLLGVIDSDQECSVLVGGQYLAIAFGGQILAQITAAAGGAARGEFLSPPPNLSVSVRNDDGVNAMTAQTAIIVDLG